MAHFQKPHDLSSSEVRRAPTFVPSPSNNPPLDRYHIKTARGWELDPRAALVRRTSLERRHAFVTHISVMRITSSISAELQTSYL